MHNSGGCTPRQSVEVPDIAGGSWTQGETVGEAIANLELKEDDISAFANVDLGEFRKTHATTDQPET